MADLQQIPQHILVTGIPGVGKTTLIKSLQEMLEKHGFKFSGFITEEVRSGGRRIGFDIVTTNGMREKLARVSEPSGFQSPMQREFKVGQYSVNVSSFEQIALSALSQKSSLQGTSQANHIYVIDEIGKMELFSNRFKEVVRKLLSQPASIVIATIPVPKGRPIPFVEEIRNSPKTTVFELTKENRNSILPDIWNAVCASNGDESNK